MNDTEIIDENTALRKLLIKKDAQIDQLLKLLDSTTRDQAKAIDKLREVVLQVYRRNIELENKSHEK